MRSKHHLRLKIENVLIYYSERRFYFVKMDISSCFDSIDQEKLLSIMKSLIVRILFFFKKNRGS